MAQEFWSGKDQIQSQEMQEVIDLLTKYNVDFKVEGNKITIKGDVKYVSFGGVSEVGITQGNNKIYFDEYSEVNRILVETPNHARDVLLTKNVHVEYDYPYLEIYF